MSIYTYNGLEFSEEDVIAKAEEKGLDLDSYINEFGIKRKEDKAPGKPKTAVKKDAVAAVKSTASKSDPFSSEQQGFDISDPTGANKAFDGAVAKPSNEIKQKPSQDIKFDPKKFAREIASQRTDGIYARGEKNIQTSGVKQKKAESDAVEEAFNSFENLNYSKLTPEEKIKLDDKAVNLLQADIKFGEPYSLSTKDIELKSQEILSKASEKKKELENISYFDRFVNGIAAGADFVGESFASMPETAYRVFAMPQNLIAKITGNEDLEATPEKFKKLTGTSNPVMDYFVDEQKRIQKNNNIYDSANYDSTSITKNIEKGNWSDAFKLLGTGLAESAPVSIAMMIGGANVGLSKLAAASTALMAGPEIRKASEENPNQSEIDNVVTGFGMAAAESVFSAIGEGSLGRVYKDIVKKEGAEIGSKIFKDGLVSAYETALKKYGAPAAMLGEGIEEVATTVTQNLISKKPAFENTMDSFISGVGGGGIYGAPVNLQKGVQNFKKGVTTYRINQELKNTEAVDMQEVFSPNTPITETQIKIASIPNSYKILNEKIDLDVNSEKITKEEGDNIKKEFAFTYHANNKAKELNLPAVDNIEVINLLKERDKLNLTIEKVNDPTLTSFQGNEVKSINSKIAAITSKAAKEKIESEIGTLTNLVDSEGTKAYNNPLGGGKTFEVFETTEDAQSAYDKWAEINNVETEDISENDGFVLPNGQILINKQVASATKALNVGSHELLHNILKSEFSNSERKVELKDKFLNVLSKAERVKLDKRLEVYTAEQLENAPDEYITQYFELIANGEVKWSDNVKETLISLWNTVLKPIFVKQGFKNIEFADGRDIYEFVKNYAKTVKKGELSERATGLLSAGENISGVTKMSKTKVAEVQAKIDNLEDQLDADEIDYDTYENKLKIFEEELKKAKLAPEVEKPKADKPKVQVTEEDEVKEIIKNERGSIASDKVQKIYETKGVNGAQDIIDLFKPITKKIVDKRREAPGFDRELLTDEVETGAGGLLDLIRTYKASSGVPLAAYINKNLPLRAIASSKRVLDKQFSKDAAEEKGLMATETADERFTETEKERPKYKNALESKVLEPEVLKTISNKILTNIRTLKSRIDAPISLNRTVTPLIAEIRDAMGKQLDIDLKTAMGGKKDNQLRSFALKNKKYFLENMTTTFLMGADGKGGIPQAIQKQIDGKWTNYPDWVGKKIDREKTTTDNAGRTSGAELVRRLPNAVNNVSDADYLGQLLESDGNPIRGRKESWAKAMGEEIAFDIINTDFLEEGPIFEAFKVNQERLGVEVANNIVVNFAKQADRGNIKFSKTYNSFSQNKKDIFNSKINELSTALNPYLTTSNKFAVKRIFKNVLIDDFSIEEINGLVEDFRPWLRQMKDMYAKNVARVEDKNFDLGTFVKNVATMHEEGVLDVLDMKFSHETLFSTDNVKDARTTTVNMFSDWVDKFGKAKAIKMMIYNGGTFKSNASLGNLIGIQVNPKTKEIELSGKKGRKSNQITENATDYWDNIVYNSLPGGNSAANQLLVEGVKKATSAQRKRDSASKSYADRDFEGRKAQSLEYRKIVQETFSYYFNPENEVSDAAKAIMVVQMGSNMETAIRKSAILTHLYVPKNGETINELRYEHTRPASQVIAEILNAYKKGKGTVDNGTLADIWDTYTAAVIPVSMDNNFNKAGFKSKMPPGWTKDVPTYYRYYNYATFGMPDIFAIESIDPKDKGAIIGEQFVKASDAMQNGIKNNTKVEAVAKSSLNFSKTAKGISVFDFDDTIGLTEGSVLYTMPDGSKGKLNAEEFAKEGSRFLEDGAIFDFSEFSKVVGGKPGPMVEKMKKMIGKFGPDNFFILTARPANAAGPIHEFLASIGIDIPLENITGLGNSAAQAKADWMVGKAAEGYNDFYFSDDAIQNVTAVKNALEVLDVKSKIQQARLKFSKTISPEFNKIIEQNTGMEDFKVFSDIVARRRGTGKNRFDFYVPASAADFELLLYRFIGKGAIGKEQKKFFDDALLKPYANGNDLMDAARQSIKKDYKALTDTFPGIKKTIESLTPDGDFTYDQAIRVAMWNEEGVEIPGISQRDSKKLTDLVNNDPELKAFKEGLIVTGRQGKGWVKPEDFWDTNTIISDLHNLTEGEGRKKFLAEFIENAELMFGKWEKNRLVGPNINKVEAVYGTNVREAIEDVLWRMTTGKNRGYGKDKETSAWANWVNGSTGTIMFLNTRSAALQLIGAVNFLNLRDNNPFAAATAFANQPQYWKDFSKIWNSDKMKERRGGLKEDVSAAEIANAASGSKNKANSVISYLLKIGYTPTQLADSFAIASGGAPYYRNRIKSYIKEGFSEQEAETKAWSDFTKVSDETQQSGDPRDISKQQASGAGRLLLTFQNTAMQQSRIVKKSFLDLKNGRGDAKTHVAKIIYYLGVQNVMFAALQQGLIAVGFGFLDDEEDEAKKKALEKEKDKKVFDITNGVIDTILSGTGFLGKVVVTLKNMVKVYLDEKDKNFKADYAKVVLEAANISPPIGSKLRKLYSGLQQTKYDKDLIKERGWGVTQDGRVHLGPLYSVTGKVVEAGTNVPLDRLVTKIENVSQAMNSQNEAWQRVMIGLGFNPYSLGVKGTKGDEEIEAKAKEFRKEEGVIKAKETREKTKDSLSNLPREERRRLKREDLLKRREKKIKKRKMG